MDKEDLINGVHQVWGMLYVILDKESRDEVREIFYSILEELKNEKK